MGSRTPVGLVTRIRAWSVRTRLILAFAGVLIPYLTLAAIGAVGLRALWQQVRAIEQEVLTELDVTADLQLALAQVVMPANDYLITGDPGEGEEFERRLRRVRELLARAEVPGFGDPEEQRLIWTVKAEVAQIEALGREILALPDPRRNPAGPVAMKALDRTADDAAAALGRVHEIAHREIAEDIARGGAAIRRVAIAGVVTLLLSVAGGVGLALLFSIWLSRPIVAIAEASHRMAEGDLSQRVEVRAGGELGETAQAFNRMAERLEALQQDLADRIRALEAALTEVKQLSGLLPICSYCRKVRSDTHYWQQLESYVSEHSDAQFTHGICPECLERERAKLRLSRRES